MKSENKIATENVLTPVNLTGVVVPWVKSFHNGFESEFKLVCNNGLEYFFVIDSEWKSILMRYTWDHVKVIGILNTSNMTLIPQKIFPKGPQGEIENVIDLATWRGKDMVKKFVQNVSDLIPVPIAL